MRNQLIKKIDSINAMRDLDKALRLYTEILSEPQLRVHLSKKEVGDVFFNRSLTQADIAERTFNAGNARLAFGMMWGAKSDIRSAQVRYSSDEDITACFVRLELHDQKRELYRSQMSSDVTQTGDTNTNTTKNKRKATTDEVSFLEHKHKVKKMTAAVNALGVFSESTTLPDIAPLSPRLKP